MEKLEKNGWFVGDNTLAISLMRFHVKITICANDTIIFYRLTVNDSNMNDLLFNFYSLMDAISFTENTINKCVTLNEIVKEYKEQYEKVTFKISRKILGK